MIVLIAPVNWVTANWLVERPILYKSTMICMKLHGANLLIATATFTSNWNCWRHVCVLFMQRRCESWTQVLKCWDVYSHACFEFPSIEQAEQVSIEKSNFSHEPIDVLGGLHAPHSIPAPRPSCNILVANALKISHPHPSTNFPTCKAVTIGTISKSRASARRCPCWEPVRN